MTVEEKIRAGAYSNTLSRGMNRVAWASEEGRLNALFFVDVLVELGLAEHPKGGVLMTLAFDFGSAVGGKEEILAYARDMAELLR